MLRYWDGQRWTEHRAAAPSASLAPPSVQYSAPSVGGATPLQQERPTATAAFVCGVLGVFIALIPFLGVVAIPLGLIALILGIVGWRRKPQRAKLAPASTILGGLAVLLPVIGLGILANSVEDIDEGFDSNFDDRATAVSTPATFATQDPVLAGPEPTCAYIGTDPDFGYMQVELAFTNPLGEVNDLEVTYALLDGEGGTRFFTGTAGGLDLVWIKFPDTNEQFRFSFDTTEDMPPNINEATIGCSVLAIEEGTDIGGYRRATDADTCVVLGTDSSGNIQVEVTATSPYEETTTVQTWWALQAPGPVTFETDTEVVDLVGAGETFKVSPRFGAEKAGWIGDGEVTCTVVGFWDQGR